MLVLIISIIPLIFILMNKNNINNTAIPFIERLRTFIEKHEGRKNYAYKDTAGKWTIGVGHLIKLPSEEWMLTQMLGEKQINDLFEKDIQTAQNAVKRLVKVPLTDGQKIALISFVFNLGEGNFQTSTLLSKLNRKDYEGAANEFPKWVNSRVNGVLTFTQGLYNRRIDEQKIFKS